MRSDNNRVLGWNRL